jgi:hypothetical protein
VLPHAVYCMKGMPGIFTGTVDGNSWQKVKQRGMMDKTESESESPEATHDAMRSHELTRYPHAVGTCYRRGTRTH